MQIPVTNEVAGEPQDLKSKTLETAASLLQDLSPVKQICGHLNAFHVYASDPTRSVEANHYCCHVNKDMRQCIIYDSPGPNARLIGIEYMVSESLFNTLPQEERKLWHSHVFEVKSGMLVMPKPSTVPDTIWDAAETQELKDVVNWYGKVYHLWQVDKGDKVPLGEPQLMTSFTAQSQFPDFEEKLTDRDKRLGTDFRRLQGVRKDIPEPHVHPDADSTWKRSEK